MICDNGEPARKDEKMEDDNKLKDMIYPLDDEMIAEQDVMEPHIVAPPLPPPPENPDEDPDGNWARPVRERIRPLPRPTVPTKDERERHALTHIPFADWCQFCVRCKGRNLPHRRLPELPEKDTLPVVSMDLAYLQRN